MDAQTFIDALRGLEERGDLESLIKLYAEDTRLWNPELGEEVAGRDAARRFWEEYRDTFSEIRSEFRLVFDEEGRAALEWTSGGKMRADGSDFTYRGVSVLEWGDDGITRFAAYFDPRKLRVETGQKAAAPSPSQGQAARGAGHDAAPSQDAVPGGQSPDEAVPGGYGASSGYAAAAEPRGGR